MENAYINYGLETSHEIFNKFIEYANFIDACKDMKNVNFSTFIKAHKAKQDTNNKIDIAQCTCKELFDIVENDVLHATEDNTIVWDVDCVVNEIINQ